MYPNQLNVYHIRSPYFPKLALYRKLRPVYIKVRIEMGHMLENELTICQKEGGFVMRIW